MRTWTVRLGLSLMVGIGWWTTKLPAQEPTAPAPAAPPAVLPVTHAVPLEAEPGHGHHRDGLLHRAARAHGYGCYATHNTVGCSSLRAELTFMFGSCRAFFGEPCVPPPPHRLRR